MAAKLLLVDDEPLIIEELQEALEFEGFDVETASSVEVALDICDGMHFDVVVTDLKMPHSSGLDLIRALIAHNHPPRFILLSGHGAERDRAEAMSLGVFDCFAKPVDPDLLARRIQDAISN